MFRFVVFFLLRHSAYKIENLKYRVIYEFHRSTSAAETALRVNDVYGVRVAKKTQCVFGSNVLVLEISTYRRNPVDGRGPKLIMKN